MVLQLHMHTRATRNINDMVCFIVYTVILTDSYETQIYRILGGSLYEASSAVKVKMFSLFTELHPCIVIHPHVKVIRKSIACCEQYLHSQVQDVIGQLDIDMSRHT